MMHVELGLYANFAAGYMKDDAINHDPGFQTVQFRMIAAPSMRSRSALRRSGMNSEKPPCSLSTITTTVDRRTAR